MYGYGYIGYIEIIIWMNYLKYNYCVKIYFILRIKGKNCEWMSEF